MQYLRRTDRTAVPVLRTWVKNKNPIMKSINHKKLWVLSLIGVFLVMSAFTTPGQQEPPHKNNLKVLPKTISHDELMGVMKGFNRALGVKCDHCHMPSKSDPSKLDFASYEKPAKKVALDMMKLTQRINAKDFGVKGAFAANFNQGKYKVSCYTCHHGEAHPVIDAPKQEGNH